MAVSNDDHLEDLLFRTSVTSPLLHSIFILQYLSRTGKLLSKIQEALANFDKKD